MIVALIVAMDRAGGIGYAGKLPWHLSSDLKRFKKLTMGHHLLTGRRTYESIGGPLTGRTMIVLSRDQDYQAPGCLIAGNLKQAFDLAAGRGEKELFVIGGVEVYRGALPFARRIYLTRVVARAKADTFFPAWDESVWRQVSSEEHPAGKGDDYPHIFQVLERVD